MVKIGIIGCGGIANNKHMPALKKLADVEMVAFCDIIEERAQKAAKEFGVPGAKVFTDYRELLKLDLDVVHVLTPNKQHSFITVDALESGKHVMCEKPMAINSAEAKKMLDAAKRTGKKLTIGYQNRFRPECLYLKKCCEAGDLGEIYYARAQAIRRRAVPTWGVFLDAENQGGGPLIDIGTHALDLTLWEMDNYEPAMVVGSTFRKLADTENAANAFGPWDPKKFTVEGQRLWLYQDEERRDDRARGQLGAEHAAGRRGQDDPLRHQGGRRHARRQGHAAAHQRRALLEDVHHAARARRRRSGLL